jgi:hypothetical protein
MFPAAGHVDRVRKQIRENGQAVSNPAPASRQRNDDAGA